MAFLTFSNVIINFLNSLNRDKNNTTMISRALHYFCNVSLINMGAHGKKRVDTIEPKPVS